MKDESGGGREIDGKPLQLNQITLPESLFYGTWELLKLQLAIGQRPAFNQQAPVLSVLQTSSGRC